MALAARTSRGRRIAAALGAIVVALSVIPLGAMAARKLRSSFAVRPHSEVPAPRQIPYPRLEWPIVIHGGQYIPLAWKDIVGWASDDHVQAYKAFRVSCASISGTASRRRGGTGSSRVSDSRASRSSPQA